MFTGRLSLITPFTRSRSGALERLEALGAFSPPRGGVGLGWTKGRERSPLAFAESPLGKLEQFLRYGGVKLHPVAFVLIATVVGGIISFAAGQILSPVYSPLFFFAGAWIVVSVVERFADRRANEFARDYPTVLLATASSLKTGMTPMHALERSTALLPEKNIVRAEVERLTKAISRGVPREQAIAEFAATIRQPDLELFRTAFLLVLENGGRFAPTLERLAGVSRDRSILIERARVSTATMRMTANILLVIAPILVAVIALRTPDFWDILLHNPTANTIATIGVLLIGLSYGVLKTMSNFRP